MSERVLGIESQHHFGIKCHRIVDGEAFADACYRLTRQFHPGRSDGYDVTDVNHTWRFESNEVVDGWSRIVIVKNELSPKHFPIRGLMWFGDENNVGATWFDHQFRIATQGTLDRERDQRLALGDKCDADAERQRDTIRGRKRRARYLAMAADYRRAAAFHYGRWERFEAEAPAKEAA